MVCCVAMAWDANVVWCRQGSVQWCDCMVMRVECWLLPSHDQSTRSVQQPVDRQHSRQHREPDLVGVRAFMECCVAMAVVAMLGLRMWCVPAKAVRDMWSECLLRRVECCLLSFRDQAARPVWQPVDRQHPRQHHEPDILAVRLWNVMSRWR